MRAPIALLAGCLLMAQAAAVSPDDLLARGRASYDAGRYADAVKDLSAAADAILGPDQMQRYVSEGKFDSLPKFETAVVYLALSYAKLGRGADARDQIQRLNAAESIAPAYAALDLPVRNDFEALREGVAAGVSPAAEPARTPAPTQTTAAAPTQMTLREGVAAGVSPAGEPARTPAPTQTAAPAPTQTTTQTAPAPAQAAPATSLTPEQQQELDRRIAQARAEFEKEAQQRIDAARVEIENEADRRIAAERAAVEKQMQEQIAAIHAAAAQQVAKSATPTIRRAEGMAIAGDIEDANAMYARLLGTPNPPRELIAAVAAGFYRTGDFAGALRAFDRLGPFARGEEDLRYYRAVALYETGRYAEAKKELECALPFIEITDEVSRYREKIEAMP